MGTRAHRPPELAGRFFRGSKAIEVGLLTWANLRGSAWRRLFHDVYMDADLPLTHLSRCRAAALILPPHAAVTGRSAACLAGMPLGEPEDPVRVVVPADRRLKAVGLSVRRAWLPMGHVEPGHPPVTVRERTIWEIARERDVVEAVVALDVLGRTGFLRPGTMDHWIAAHPRSRASRALELSDPRAESPQETRLRVRLVLEGLPSPVPQHDIHAHGDFVARVDLAWPDRKVAVEYDGLWHNDRRQFQKDRARLNRLVAAGWDVIHLTARDLSDSVLFARFIRQLRTALETA